MIQEVTFPSLLFYLPLILILHEINSNNYAYKVQKNRFNHLIYIHDINLFAKDYNELKGLWQYWFLVRLMCKSNIQKRENYRTILSRI